MAQPQAYNRETDFTDRDGDDTDHAGINSELDAAALSINELRTNLAQIQRDDGALKNGIVTADSLADSAFNAVLVKVNEAVQDAEEAASSALVSATTANNSRDQAVAARIASETARDATIANANAASASALAASNSQTAAAASQADALASKNAAASSQTAAAASATSASNSAGTATAQAGIATTKAAESAASATASASSAAGAQTARAGAEAAQSAAETARNQAQTSATSAAGSASAAAASAASIDPAQFLRKADNLTGLADAAAARTNLGLGTAATQPSTAFATAAQGTLAGTALQPDAIGVSVQGFDAAIAKTNAAQTFTAAQRGTVSTLTDAATVTPDFAVANNFSLTLGGNRTLANPTNLVAGQSGVIRIAQDATGSRTLAYGSAWKFASGTVPTLTTTANAVDVLAYYVESSTRITARLIGDVR